MAVRRGRPRPGRRVPRARPAGHRRQRQPLQPDRRRRDQPDPGHRRPGRARGRPHARARRLADGGETVLLLGETRPEFGGSAWASVVHGHLGGRPPVVQLAAERALGELLAVLGGRLVSSAHDLADGGLAQTVAESALRYGVGATLESTPMRSPRCSASPPPARRHHRRPGSGARGGRGRGRPGHRARRRRRAGRPRSARPGARGAAGRPGRRPCPRCSGRRRPRTDGAVPSS